MKDQQNYPERVSLIFYSEEEGKRAMIGKWGIEIGKKYTIGRSNKKVDITIQDINISRVQAELIFYDKDTIMIKDLNSSNGTYINKERIEPNKEKYCSLKDNISIGDEKIEIIFELPEELKIKKKEKRISFNFDDKLENKKYEVYEKFVYFKNEKNNEDINYTKNISDPYSKDFSYKRNFYKKDKDDRDDKYFKKEEEEFDKDNKYEKTDNNIYNKYDKKDRYDSYDKYDIYNKNNNYDKNDKYYKNDEKFDKNNKYDKYDKIDKYKKEFKKYARSRSRKESKYRKYSSTSSKEYDNSWNKSPKNSKEKQKTKNEENKKEEFNKKSKYKNISSYIIKKDTAQEEEIEREYNKRQIELYNEYLECKKEREELIEITNLPSLLPILIPHPKESDYNDDDSEREENEKNEIFRREIFNKSFLRKRKRIINSFGDISIFRNRIIKINDY